MKLLGNDVFDSICKFMCEKLKVKNFKCKKDEKDALFYGEKAVYKVELCSEENKICLKQSENNDNNLYDFDGISSWLFDEQGMSSKDIKMICDDFIETICDFENPGKDTSLSYKKQKKKNSDGLFFANRLVNIFPELKEDIFIEKECYSEFRGTIFVEKNILPLILDLLDNGKDLKKIQKLFKILSDLYNSASINIRSLITMGIMNNITDTKSVELAQKYINDDLKKAWDVSIKFKHKKIRPSKISFYQKMMSNANLNK